MSEKCVPKFQMAFFYLFSMQVGTIQAIYGLENPDDKATTDFYDNLLANYDGRIRPNFNGAPVNVTMTIHVLSLGSIAETTMDYRATVFLRQKWRDPRLQFENTASSSIFNYSAVTLDPSFLAKLWVPDTFIVNEKVADFHQVTKDNKLLRLYRDGSILYSARLSMTLSCPMKLHQFPMDDQVCTIQLESYAYTMDGMVFRWGGEESVSLDQTINLPQFDLTNLSYFYCTRVYSTGSYPCLEARFYLSRQMGYYIIQTYIPSLLIVILSWLSFFISAEASPARVALGITTVLTMTTQSSGALQSLPKVSYIKAIDLWMAVCLLFVFLALIEFAVVNYVLRQQKRREKRNMMKRRLVQALHEEGGGGSSSYPSNGSSTNKKCSFEKTATATEYTYVYETHSEPVLRPDFDKLPIIVAQRTIAVDNGFDDFYNQSRRSPNGITTDDDVTRKRFRSRNSQPKDDAQRVENDFDGTMFIDLVSRIVFPVSFLLFNAFYWINFYYFGKLQSSNT